MRNIDVKFSKKGVLLKEGDHWVKVASAIKLIRILRHATSGNEYGVIRFRARGGSSRTARFPMSDFNYHNRNHIMDGLSNKGYHWPSDPHICRAIIHRLAEKHPGTEHVLVDAFGWHDDSFFTAAGQFPKSAPTTLVIDDSVECHRAPYLLGPGSLKGWKQSVAIAARRSAPLRLSICAGFAAPLLRKLGMRSFGINMFGPTSQGKTSLLYAASSVAGLIASSGLPTWADTPAAIEELFLGYRDCILPLDETADGDGRGIPLHEKSRSLSMGVSRNNVRRRASSYERSVGVGTRDFRTIILSTSERALSDIASQASQERIGGEELRLIDLPVVQEGQWGVFKNAPKAFSGMDRAEAGKRMADGLRRAAERHQGYAFQAFLKNITSSKFDLKGVKQEIAHFNGQNIRSADPAGLRLKDNFALLFAAGSLAIDFGIVPWKRKALLADVLECWEAAAECISGADTASADRAILTVWQSVNSLPLCKIRNNKADLKRSELDLAAKTAFQQEDRLYIPRKVLPSACKPHLRRLATAGILITEGRTDALTMAKRLPGIAGKPRYYVINRALLKSERKRATEALRAGSG